MLRTVLTFSVCVGLGLALSSCSGGGGGNSGGGGGSNDDPGIETITVTEVEGDFQLLEVSQPDGTTDDVWVYAAAPTSGGPFPVVIYARGQGQGDFINCRPNAPNGPGQNFQQGIGTTTNNIASLGYLAVAVLYRNAGSGSPSGSQLKIRDHYILDARCVLTAAQWAKNEHGQGSSKIAFIGTSAGTSVAAWAATPHEQLVDLQEGLDLKTLVIAGESANIISSQATKFANVNTDDPLSIGQNAIDLMTASLRMHAGDLGMTLIDADDLDNESTLADALSNDLTPEGITVLKSFVFDPADEALPGCDETDGLPPLCGDECGQSTLATVFTEETASDLSTWLTDDALEIQTFWNPPATVEPPTDNPNQFLQLARVLSPAYAASGEALCDRMLMLVSTNDSSHYDPDAVQLLLDRFSALGVSITAAPSIDRDSSGECGHTDYLEPERGCGFDELAQELQAAFE